MPVELRKPTGESHIVDGQPRSGVYVYAEIECPNGGVYHLVNWSGSYFDAVWLLKPEKPELGYVYQGRIHHCSRILQVAFQQLTGADPCAVDYRPVVNEGGQS